MKVKSKFTLVFIVIVVAIATIDQVNNINKYDIFYVFNSKVDLISYIDMDSAHAGFELRDKVSVAYFEQTMRMHAMIPPQPPSHRYTSAKPAIIYLKNRGFIEVNISFSLGEDLIVLTYPRDSIFGSNFYFLDLQKPIPQALAKHLKEVDVR